MSDAISQIEQQMQNPKSEFRGAPFWAWNGKLDPTELRRQIRLMRRMGLGGFFMHSRVGLNTPYLSDEWFECIEACVDEAEKQDMQAWLYDEDRWPSGAAGGLVTQNPQYRQQLLVMEVCGTPKAYKPNKTTLAAFSATVANSTASNITRIAKTKAPAKLDKGEVILHFYIKTADCSSWYNDQTYLDTLNSQAVKEFIKVTHQEYAKRLKGKLGKSVPGIFTDEPNYGRVCQQMTDNSYSSPWTQDFEKVFKAHYKYDLIPRLPELFYDVKGARCEQPRHNYIDCVTNLFVTAFSKQIGEWCEKNNMLSTGHVLSEDTLSHQTAVVGSAMRSYEYMQAPGMDLLTEHWRIYDTAKQVSSAANQFGRQWRLSETYGCTGWDFPFSGHKALGDWQVALGINLRCQHLSWYTMEGEAKRDYPASISYQSPWWEVYSKVEDYFARINQVMSNGSEVRDLLVIHPIESAWTKIKIGYLNDKAVLDYDHMLINVRNQLLNANIDFDYGDEEILSKHANVTGNGKTLRMTVNKAKYKTILVPSLITIRSSTLKLLKAFKAKGGKVIFAGRIPELLDTIPSDEPAKFAATCEAYQIGEAKLVNALEDIRLVSILDEKNKEIPQTLHLLREDKDAYYLFICNTGHSEKQLNGGRFNKFSKATTFNDPLVRDRLESFPSVKVELRGENLKTAIEVDPDNATLYLAESKASKNGLEIKTDLPQLGSRMFVIPKKAVRRAIPKRKQYKEVMSLLMRHHRWNIVLSEPNVLVLDTPSWKIGSGQWRKPLEILKVDNEVRESIGVAHRGGQMVQPWAREQAQTPKRTIVELKYTFNVRSLPEGELFLALEHPESFKVNVNGALVDSDMSCGWWCDRSMEKLKLPMDALKTGDNEIILTCDYSENHPGLEMVYLLGNFGVKVTKKGLIVREAPTNLLIGDWTKQGLPFYSGNVLYKKTIRQKINKNERMFIKIPAYLGTAVRIIVEGETVGVIAWEPNEIDITDHLHKKGEVTEVLIEVVGHRRNSHGPLHNTEKWPVWTGPAQFKSADGMWVDDYQLVPCGLMEAPLMVIRK